VNWYWWWKNWVYNIRHICPLPTAPEYWEPNASAMFTCPRCDQEWRLEWVSDIIEPTIAQPVDLGGWAWRRMP
jgi:hypothetical protein